MSLNILASKYHKLTLTRDSGSMDWSAFWLPTRNSI